MPSIRILHTAISLIVYSLNILCINDVLYSHISDYKGLSQRSDETHSQKIRM